MSWTIKFEALVIEDLEAAGDWYEKQESGAGDLFDSAVDRALETLKLNPLAYRIRNRKLKIRWCVPKKFPYKIIYRVEGDTVIVVAVMHSARHDRVWKKRL